MKSLLYYRRFDLIILSDVFEALSQQHIYSLWNPDICEDLLWKLSYEGDLRRSPSKVSFWMDSSNRSNLLGRIHHNENPRQTLQFLKFKCCNPTAERSCAECLNIKIISDTILKRTISLTKLTRIIYKFKGQNQSGNNRLNVLSDWL